MSASPRSPLAACFNDPMEEGNTPCMLNNLEMEEGLLPAFPESPVSFAQEEATAEAAEAMTLPLPAAPVAPAVCEPSVAEQTELLERSMHMLDQYKDVEKRLAQSQESSRQELTATTAELEATKSALLKNQHLVAELQAQSLASEQKYVSLLTQFQSQSSLVSQALEVEEALALAQNRMSEYASENASLRAKLSDLLDNPASSFALEKENQSLLLCQAREQLREMEAQRNQALEEAKMSAEAEQESEQQISQCGCQRNCALPGLRVVRIR